jgi:glycosyltransferase involved in cell wall biosynthesis
VADGAPERALATPVGDPEALARGILLLLHDPAQRHALARAAQEWARAHDADWTAGRIESLYAELGT